MRWEDERYVRLYTRDTPNWVLAPWEGRVVLPLVMRKIDRAGMLDLGEDAMEGLAALIQVPLEVAEKGMAWWLKKKTFELHGPVLVMPNYLDAQECASSDKKRAREHRERAKTQIAVSVTNRDETITECDADDTHRDDSSRAVTERHAPSQVVTPYRTVPCRTVPDQIQPVAGVEGDQPAVVLPDTETRLKVASAPSRASRRSMRTAIPDDWKPSDRCLEILAEEHVPGGVAIACVKDFIDYWRSEDGRKADWDATFRGRVRFLRSQGRLPSPVDDSEEMYVEIMHGKRVRQYVRNGVVVRSEPEEDDSQTRIPEVG